MRAGWPVCWQWLRRWGARAGAGAGAAQAEQLHRPLSQVFVFPFPAPFPRNHSSFAPDHTSASTPIHKPCRHGAHRWQLPVVPAPWLVERLPNGEQLVPGWCIASICTFIFRVVLLMLPIQHLAGNPHKGSGGERLRTTCSLADINKRLTHVWWTETGERGRDSDARGKKNKDKRCEHLVQKVTSEGYLSSGREHH